MNKILPKILITLFISIIFVNAAPVYGSSHASPSPSPSPSASVEPADIGQWVQDQEVTFVGKVAARSSDVLNWVISNYQWADFKLDANSPDQKNPFNPIWKTIRFIVYLLLTLFILAGAFLIIITRGVGLSIQKFIPRFIFVLVLVTLSFSIIQFLYQITDALQGFFLHRPGSSTEFISSQDLLNVSFDYKNFEGYRRIGTSSLFEFDESAFIHLLLVKLTAATYYVMFILLTLRKVILWFFIIVSPVFPLLILFSPLRNSAKIWIGEFFRWLLYAPLFAIFLYGLVALWQIYIPINTKLPCDKPITPQLKQEYDFKYPTSINILLGGPCQKLADPNTKDVDLFNNLNNPDSFIQYIVALLMIWMVIIMPFILLKIFLDYFNNYAFKESGIAKYLVNKPTTSPPRPPDLSRALSQAKPNIIIKPPPSISPYGSAGLARQLPREIFTSKDTSQGKPQFIGDFKTQQNIKVILDQTKINIPTIKDISRIEAALTSKTSSYNQETSKMVENFKRLSGTSELMTPQEKIQAQELIEKLKVQSQEGNEAAKAVVEATKNPVDTDLPDDNKLQTVNVEDYEEVKKTWTENYQKLEPPPGPDGQDLPRIDWVQKDKNEIPKVIDLLLSTNPQENKQGKQMVSRILPFLLLGGFSKAEIVTYLKAKLEAAKTVYEQLEKEEKDEDSQVFVEARKNEELKTMQASQDLPEAEEPSGVEKNHLGETPVQLYPKQSQPQPTENVKIKEE